MALWGTEEAERRTSVVVLAALAALTVLWWIALATSATVRRWFELDGDRSDVLSAFVLADLVVVAGGSAVSAVAVARGAPGSRALVAWTAGGWAYATLVLAGWVGLGGDGALGLLPMAVATVVVSFLALRPPVRA